MRRITIPQARLLQKHYAAIDGHRDTARIIVESLIDLAVTMGYVKRAAPAAATRRPETDQAAVILPDTLLPELRAAVQAQLSAEGWQPPAGP